MSRNACPYGSGARYDACCGVLHSGARRAATAADLMRARYSAFTVADADYLLATWHPATRPERLDLDAGVTWTGLAVLATEAGGPDDTRGVVEFRAAYVAVGGPGALHEVSRFVRLGGAWVYVRGRLVSE